MNTLLIGNGYWGNIIKPKLEKLTNLIGVVDSKTDINSFLGDKIDFAFVCTPTNTHYKISKILIENNINIFCEKPFTGDINLANELYKMSVDKNTIIYVDNIFLLRDEIKNIEFCSIEKLEFLWKKNDNNYKENLINSLMYHDLYLTNYLIKKNSWVFEKIDYNEKNLDVVMNNDQSEVRFIYDRGSDLKEKIIIVNDTTKIDISNPKNDPLNDTIIKIINKEIDYESNKIITLETLELIQKIK